MIIIADGGSTKIDWVVAGSDGTVALRTTSPGVNPSVMDGPTLLRELSAAAPALAPYASGASLHFYGAGCLPAVAPAMSGALASLLPGLSRLEVESDLLGAARGLLGRSPGVACILGTGSNSCRYDGRRIVDNIPSLGFILGDEGSGAWLGKRLVADALKRRLPAGLAAELLESRGLDLQETVRRVYREPAPNRFLASMAPFAVAHASHPAVSAVIAEGFRLFLERNVAPYGAAGPVAFCGGIAAALEGPLRAVAAGMGIAISSVTHSPLDGLAVFHTNDI